MQIFDEKPVQESASGLHMEIEKHFSQLYPHTLLQIKGSLYIIYHALCMWISYNFDDFRSLCV